VKTKPLRSTVELILTVAVALFFALTIQAFAVKPYRIPSESMVPTLEKGQRILVNRFSHKIGGDPKLGDVTVFTPPDGADNGECGNAGQGPFYEGGAESRQSCSQPTGKKADTTFVKRVVGMPGDTIAVVNGRVIRNGKRAKEDFILPCQPGEDCSFPKQITVPKDHWFMMGDNRGASDDSRFWGPVPKKWIIGGAFATYWPPKRIGLL